MLLAFILITTLGITLMIENNHHQSLLEVVYQLAEHFTAEWLLISLTVACMLALLVVLMQWLSNHIRQLTEPSKESQVHSTLY